MAARTSRSSRSRAAFHPDFDDAAYGGVNRHVWRPHWVVLAKDEACGAGGLKVKDSLPGVVK